MNIEIITEGRIFKNHRIMCEELGIPFKNNTNSKKAQLKDLGLYCNWSKSGNSIVVGEVFDNPLRKFENRGKKSIYGEKLQYLISKVLVNTKEGHISISRNRLMVLINMVNENYGLCSQYVKALSEHTSIEEKIIYDFYNTNNNNFKSAIEIALDNLMDKRLVMYSKIIKVCAMEEGEKVYRNASKIEQQVIMSSETKAFKKLGYSSVSEVRSSKDFWKFKSYSKELIKAETEILYYYFAYDITINREYIEEGNNELLKQIIESSEFKKTKQSLNKTVKHNIMKNAKKRHKDAAWFGKKMDKYRMQDDYLDKINKLIKILIDDSTKSIEKIIMSLVNEDGAHKMTPEIQEQLDNLEDLFS